MGLCWVQIVEEHPGRSSVLGAGYRVHSRLGDSPAGDEDALPDQCGSVKAVARSRNGLCRLPSPVRQVALENTALAGLAGSVAKFDRHVERHSHIDLAGRL